MVAKTIKKRECKMVMKASAVMLAAAVAAACSHVDREGTTVKSLVEHASKTSEPTLLQPLIQLESTQQQEWLKAEEARFELKPSSGHTQLTMTFSPDVNTSRVHITPPNGWDLSAHPESHIAFEVENHEDVSTHFYVMNKDPQGNSQARSLSLPAHYKGTVYIPLRGKQAETDIGFWGDAEPWETSEKMMIWRSWRGEYDRTALSSLVFYSIGILEEKTISVSNIRLRKNPSPNANWLTGLVDKFGQNAKEDYPIKIHSEKELKLAAQKELAELAASKGVGDRSQYGGYAKGPKLKATGYFRTEKVDGKWWMVDPEGYLFFSHGPANVRMANLTTLTGVDFKDPNVRIVKKGEMTPEDSMGIIKVPDSTRETRYITLPERHNLFEWLPSYDDPLAEHYSYRRSTHKGPIEHGETFSFYRANLERRYGQTSPESYVKKWEEVTLARMKDWGFTSFGNWVDPAFYEYKQVPYFANGWIIGDFQTLSGYENHWGLMPDPFDPVFAERARLTIEKIADDVKRSPWCVGIFIDNEKSWGEREGTVPQRYGVILDALSKDAQSSPAKKAFSRHLRQQYQTISQLNSAWGTHIGSWAELDRGVTFKTFTDQHVADLSKMLERLGEQYFTVVHNTLERTLPNHLYMGARMANWGMPDEIIKASLAYSDVLSFNIYEEGMQPKHWGFLDEVDLPVVIGEFHIGSTDGTGFLQPGIVHAANPKDRAQMYKDYMHSLLEKPYMVGAHWFQYVDEPVSGRAFDGENANIGFVTGTDIPYPEMISAVKEVMTDIYPKRYGK